MGFQQKIKNIISLDYKYAFLEILLIVIGILIALWVDTWWQGKQDIKKEQAYLSALKSELEENQSKYEANLTALNSDIETTNAFLMLLKTNPQMNLPADSLSGYLWPLITIETISPTRAALDDIINSGGMQYIRSDILRRQIATYKQSFEYDFEQQRATADLWNKTLSVFNLNNINISQLVPPATGGYGLEKKRSLDVPQMRFASTFSAQDRREYANRLTQRVLLISRLRKTHNTVLKNIRVLLFQLARQNPTEQPQNTTIRG